MALTLPGRMREHAREVAGRMVARCLKRVLQRCASSATADHVHTAEHTANICSWGPDHRIVPSRSVRVFESTVLWHAIIHRTIQHAIRGVVEIGRCGIVLLGMRRLDVPSSLMTLAAGGKVHAFLYFGRSMSAITHGSHTTHPAISARGPSSSFVFSVTMHAISSIGTPCRIKRIPVLRAR